MNDLLDQIGHVKRSWESYYSRGCSFATDALSISTHIGAVAGEIPKGLTADNQKRVRKYTLRVGAG